MAAGSTGSRFAARVALLRVVGFLKVHVTRFGVVMMSAREACLSRNRVLLLVARSLGFSIAAGIPTITYLWEDRGMSRGQFYLLEIFFAVMLMALEVVTGRFADRFGKVLTLKLGFIAQALGSLVYAFAGSFGDFIIGEALFALGLALNSGTDEALLFQSNKAVGQEDKQQRWWSTTIGWGFVSMGLFSIIGAYLATIDLELPFLFAAGCGFSACALCFLMAEPPVENTDDDAPPGGSLKQALATVLFASGSLRWMMIAPGFIVSINQTYLWMYPEYLKDCELSTASTGLVYALFNLVAGATALWLRRIESDRVGMVMVFVLILAVAASTVGLLSVVGALAWLVILPQQMVRSVSGSLFSGTLNKAIPDEVRVTALSIRNALRVILYVSVLTPWWLGVDSLGRNGMFQVNLLMLGFAAVLFWISRPRESAVGN